MITDLYKDRSYARCVSEGYAFLAKNVWMVCRVIGPYFLVFSLVFVLSNAVNTHANVSMLAGKEIFLEEVIVAIVLTVLAVVAYIAALVRLYRMYKRLCGMEGKKKIHIYKVCKAVFRHFGKVIGTTLLALFILAAVSAVVYLPYVTSMYAYFSSVEAQVNFGDTATIPTSGYVMMVVACTLCYTIINIFSVGFYTSMLYLYGSIRGTYSSSSGARSIVYSYSLKLIKLKQS